MSISEKRTFTVRCSDCAREVIKESGTFVWSSITEWLDCDCCGGNAAPFPVMDGDALQCGCSGSVICDEGDGGEPTAWTHSELPCSKCLQESNDE